MKTTAKDIMSTKLIVAKEGMPIQEAVKLLVNNKITGLPVINERGQMTGILSEYDIIAAVGRNERIEAELFQQQIVYTKDIELVTEETLLEDILNKFIQLKCRRLPVLDKDKRLVGIISRRDIMKVLYYRAMVNE